VSYIKKFKKNPITAQPLALNDLVKLHFYKNAKGTLVKTLGDYHCPMTYNVFTEYSHIIAIAETGNVYSYEAYEQLNKNPKHFFDLLNGTPFDPKNVIVLQDPKATKKNIYDFAYMKKAETAEFGSCSINSYSQSRN